MYQRLSFYTRVYRNIETCCVHVEVRAEPHNACGADVAIKICDLCRFLKPHPAQKCSPRCATATLITSTACHNPPHGALRTAEVRTPPRHSSKKNPSRTKVHHSLTASPMHRIATRWTWTHCSTPKLRNS